MISRDQLEKMKQSYENARDVYYNYKSDGSLDGDIEYAKLMNIHIKLEKEYNDAIQKFIEHGG